MRIDHHAYRKATRVAAFGFLLQAVVALFLLAFGVLGTDTVFRFASFYLVGGLFAWLSLIVVFYQHTQERLEALEEDELAAARAGAESVFASSAEQRVAARRLRLMHGWLMPAVSVLLVAYLGGGALWMLRRMGTLGAEVGPEEGATFQITAHMGWGVAVCLAFAAVCFIFSRFVAGMARQAAWQNLRGGAGYMVGNALVMLACAAGLILRFFREQPADQEAVMRWVAYAIPAFMLLLAVEIVIHFILNIYRPRIPGEYPRPAFDSRILSLLAAPESIVRSLNEAVNYQFGFDITSSWGYQLFLRSIGGLLAFGALVLVWLNMMVVVEPHQQAIKLAGGSIVGDVQGPGVMWKLPWPFQTAAVEDVWRVRELPLTPPRTYRNPDVQLWSVDPRAVREADPFIVGGVRRAAERAAAGSAAEFYSLVDADLRLRYRIKPDALLDFLTFANDRQRRRDDLSVREEALRSLGLRVVTRHLSALRLEDVIATDRAELLRSLQQRLQETFDEMQAGVEVVGLTAPMLRPAGDVARFYEDYMKARAQREETVASAERTLATSLAHFIGDPQRADEILAAIDRWHELRNELGPDHEDVERQALAIEALLRETGGRLAAEIARAEAQRWVRLMEARAEAFRHQGQLVAYRAAPALYMQRELMRVLSEMLADRRKYVLVGIDPARVDVNVALEEQPSLLTFGDALPSEDQEESGQ